MFQHLESWKNKSEESDADGHYGMEPGILRWDSAWPWQGHHMKISPTPMVTKHWRCQGEQGEDDPVVKKLPVGQGPSAKQ